MKERMLNGRYRVEGELGRGGMSSVWRGVDTVLGRTVAIKVLRPRNDEAFVARFRREAQTAAGLNHPNIVSVYDTGSDNGVQYIVMELVEGETLADLLRRDGRLPPKRVAEIGAAIAQGLHAAHEAGLVHRDVKPGNVMVTERGQVKVMDFGIARSAADDTLTQTGTILGTAAYLAPEQARGERTDARTDVYALGCVLYEMATGSPPFTGEAPVQVAYRHVNEEPRPPSQVAPVPAELEGVIMRALAKDPERRFPSAGALNEALTRTAGGPDTEPMTPPTDVLPTVSVPRLEWRRWWPLGVGAALVAAVIGVVALTGETPAGRGERRSPGAGAQSPTPTAPLYVPGAFRSLEQVVTEGAVSGEITEGIAQKLSERIGTARDLFRAGDPAGALDELTKAHEEVTKALERGEIDPGAAERVVQAISVTANTILAVAPSPAESPSPEEGDDGGEDSGPGNSEFAPGHNKGKGKGEKD